jgi:hypothetical protein
LPFAGQLSALTWNKIRTVRRRPGGKPVSGAWKKLWKLRSSFSAGILLTVLGGLLGVVLGRYIWPAIRDSYTAALLTAQNAGYEV